mmetsp:Transcript_28156/g.87263  ORF Transcript_28156/g.87263 Transcript_28156/m.87263 type:complete len:304 (-) Transcript_28156:102-1013(-)
MHLQRNACRFSNPRDGTNEVKRTLHGRRLPGLLVAVDGEGARLALGPVVGVAALRVADHVVVDEREDADVLERPVLVLADLADAVAERDGDDGHEVDDGGADGVAQLEAAQRGAAGCDQVIDEHDAVALADAAAADRHGVGGGLLVLLAVRRGLDENTRALLLLAQHHEGDAEGERDGRPEEEPAGVKAEHVRRLLVAHRLVAGDDDVDGLLEQRRILGQRRDVVEAGHVLRRELGTVPHDRAGDLLGDGGLRVEGHVRGGDLFEAGHGVTEEVARMLGWEWLVVCRRRGHGDGMAKGRPQVW